MFPFLRPGQFELTRDRACIADVIALVAGTPIGKFDVHGPAEMRSDEAQNALQTDGIRRPAAPQRENWRPRGRRRGDPMKRRMRFKLTAFAAPPPRLKARPATRPIL